jgi:hypothetical protein
MKNSTHVLPPVSIREFPQPDYLGESKPFLISVSVFAALRTPRPTDRNRVGTPSPAALPAITHLICIEYDAWLPRPNRRTELHTPASESLSSVGFVAPALYFVMQCNIALMLTNYYRKKRHRAEYGVAVVLTVICWQAIISTITAP